MKKEKINNMKEKNDEFALGPKNYKMIAIGFGIIILGFILMAGGKSNDPKVFDPAIFSFRRITLAPLVVLFGFIFEIWAIMKKTETETEENEQ
jgi:hypothetical protein